MNPLYLRDIDEVTINMGLHSRNVHADVMDPQERPRARMRTNHAICCVLVTDVIFITAAFVAMNIAIAHACVTLIYGSDEYQMFYNEVYTSLKNMRSSKSMSINVIIITTIVSSFVVTFCATKLLVRLGFFKRKYDIETGLRFANH